MAQHDPSPPEFEGFQVQEDRKDPQPSMIFSILPAVVQNRIPALPSLRRSITDLHTRTLHAKSPSIDTEISVPPTPPPRYCSRPGSGTATPTLLSLTPADGEETDGEDASFQGSLSERPQSSSSTFLPPFSLSESETGINWKYANQGINLTTQAYQESSIRARRPSEGSVTLTRQLYLHGITYLLRGLPENLTPDESLGIIAAIPPSLMDLNSDLNDHAMISIPEKKEDPSVEDSGPPSLLHRLTAIAVFQTFVLLQLLLPYVKLFLGHAYRFERKHQITQRVMSKSITTVDELSRRGLQLSHTVCQMNDGKVGQAINDLTLWWVRGLTGGLQQGITDGVVMIQMEKDSNRNRRKKDTI
ncbi:hypothetical protein BU24DRAFT_416510 [Aaosphaeria arxii CBS 175.79]|uniref:Uncharacterized protein n=1 Tax=Aaosphaeria arxii CBS 175.79 TaxID=1450172 RepID=A0A6A5Y734_9PLEO|nr:uncharacterized protein BU24DRAFT_416510 [Aaosphaeria arxii CBS 175.79]KAF2020837.1 hypothetical protein BU24DRAFT_416510 [Aaosphaeria arxii CBS 175.79]